MDHCEVFQCRGWFYLATIQPQWELLWTLGALRLLIQPQRPDAGSRRGVILNLVSSGSSFPLVIRELNFQKAVRRKKIGWILPS